MIAEETVPISEPTLQQQTEAEYDATVRADIELFRSYSEKWVAGEITDDQFRAQRLRRGIYTQRQAGVHMIRTKVPGGILTAAQMDRLALIADEFCGGKGHLTTRQNIQYHFVPLAQVPSLLHQLADVRLTTREACYNTVRNVTACPLSGLLEDEVFDVHPYARQVAFAFLHKEVTDSLPRKFKISFSGCKDDCMIGAIHDIGLRAVIRDGQRGFRMVVGGGLGPLPVEAQLLDDFVPVERLVNRCEAVIRVFGKYGNRKQQEQGEIKICCPRARLHVGEGADRKRIPGHPRQWRHSDSGNRPRRIRWFSISTTTSRLGRLAARRSGDVLQLTDTRTRSTSGGSVPTSAGKSSLVTRWSPSKYRKATSQATRCAYSRA